MVNRNGKIQSLVNNWKSRSWWVWMLWNHEIIQMPLAMFQSSNWATKPFRNYVTILISGKIWTHCWVAANHFQGYNLRLPQLKYFMNEKYEELVKLLVYNNVLKDYVLGSKQNHNFSSLNSKSKMEVQIYNANSHFINRKSINWRHIYVSKINVHVKHFCRKNRYGEKNPLWTRAFIGWHFSKKTNVILKNDQPLCEILFQRNNH